MDTQYLLLVWFCCLTPFFPMFCCRNKDDKGVSNCPDYIAYGNSDVTNKDEYKQGNDVFSRITFNSSFLSGIKRSAEKTKVRERHSPPQKTKPGPRFRQAVRAEELWERMLATFQFKVLPLFLNLCAWLSTFWLFTLSSAQDERTSDPCFPNTKPTGEQTGKPSRRGLGVATSPDIRPSRVERRRENLRYDCHLKYLNSFFGTSNEENGLTHDLIAQGELSLNSAFIESGHCSNTGMSSDVATPSCVLPYNLYDACSLERPTECTETMSCPIMSSKEQLQRKKALFKDDLISSNSPNCNSQSFLQPIDKEKSTEEDTIEKVTEDAYVRVCTKCTEEVSTTSESKKKQTTKAVSYPSRWTASSRTNRLGGKPTKCALPFPDENSLRDLRKLAVEFSESISDTRATRSTCGKHTRGVVLDIGAFDVPEETKHSPASKRHVGVIGERGDLRKLASRNSCDIVSSSTCYREKYQDKAVSNSSLTRKSKDSSETCVVCSPAIPCLSDSELKPNIGNKNAELSDLPLANHFELDGSRCGEKGLGSTEISGLFAFNDASRRNYWSKFDPELSSSSTSSSYELCEFEGIGLGELKDARLEEFAYTSGENLSQRKSHSEVLVDTPVLSIAKSADPLSAWNPSEKADITDNLSPNSTESVSSRMVKFHNFCLRLLETSFCAETDDEESNPDITSVPSLNESQQHELLALFKDQSPEFFKTNFTQSDSGRPEENAEADARPTEYSSPQMCLSDPEGRLEQVPLFCSMLVSSCVDVGQLQKRCAIPHTEGRSVEPGTCVVTDECRLSFRLPLAEEQGTDQASTEENKNTVPRETTLSSTSTSQIPTDSVSDQDGHQVTSKKSARSKGPMKLPDVPMDVDFVYMSCKAGRLVPVKDFIRILESCYLGVDEKKDIVSQQYTIARDKCCLDWIEAIRNRGKRILPKWWLHRYMRAEGLESNKCRKRREWLEKKQAQALEEERLREKKDLFFLGSRSDITRYLEEPVGPEKILFSYGEDGVPGFHVEQYFAMASDGTAAPSLTSEIKVDLNVGQPSRWLSPVLSTPRDYMTGAYWTSPGRSRSAGGEPREHPGTQEAEVGTSQECQPVDRAVEVGSGDSFCES